MFEYTNPHPKGKNVKDCVKRALTIALEMDYKEVEKNLRPFVKERREEWKEELINKNMYSYATIERSLKKIKYKSLNVFTKYLKIIATQIEKPMGYFTVGDIAERYQEGSYLVLCHKHIVAITNGVIKDTWDSSSLKVEQIWKVK